MSFVIQYGSTGLMRASAGGYTETVSVLLEAKADPNITDEVKLHYSHCLIIWCIMLQYGDTALHYAAARGKIEIINQLVKHGAAVDITRGKVLNFILQIVHCSMHHSAVSKMCILNCSYNN